jgi:hypothetical protein
MKALGILIFVASGLIGMFGSLELISHELGFIGGVIAFMLFPVTLTFAPWYAVFAYGDWHLLQIIYGGAIAGSVLMSIGGK